MEQILDKTHPKWKHWYQPDCQNRWASVKELKARLKKGSDAVKKPPWIDIGEWNKLIDESLVDISNFKITKE